MRQACCEKEAKFPEQPNVNSHDPIAVVVELSLQSNFPLLKRQHANKRKGSTQSRNDNFASFAYQTVHDCRNCHCMVMA